MTSITITIDDDLVQAHLVEIERDIDRLVGEVAKDLARESAIEGGRSARAIGDPWSVEGVGTVQRTVEAPVWWAHFVARGTRAHGPTRAPFLVFEIDGKTIRARQVSGMAADPFDVRAVRKTQSHVDDIVRRLFA